MNQREINQAEWANPGNWSGSLLGVYFSKADSRVWVPKSIPWMGWTLNVAHPAGVRWLFALLLFPFFVLLAAVILMAMQTRSASGESSGDHAVPAGRIEAPDGGGR